jgi:hypothetical protein
MGNSMGIIIQNIGNIVVSDRKSSLFSDIQTGLALSKWPPIVLKFCMVASQSANFNIRPVLEESKILRYMVTLPSAWRPWRALVRIPPSAFNLQLLL